jgi:hypothetical protein
MVGMPSTTRTSTTRRDDHPSERTPPMPESATTPAADRATVRFQAEPRPAMLCSNCGGDVSDDDAECATCESPIDWGASSEALHAWANRPGG